MNLLKLLMVLILGMLGTTSLFAQENKSFWCVKPEFETTLSMSFADFQKLETIAPKFSKSEDDPKSQVIDFSGIKKRSRYQVPFKKFQKPLYFLFESTQNTLVVYVDEAHECVYPVHALTKESEIDFSDEQLSFYGNLFGPEGETEFGRVTNFKFKNLNILQQNFNQNMSTLTDISSGKIFEVGHNLPESRVVSYQNRDYYVAYLGNGRLKIWDIDSARLLDEIQLFEKLGAPSFFYLQGPIYDSFETGSAQRPYDLFSDDSCLRVSSLNKDWVQDQLSRRSRVNDDSRYDHNLRLNYEVESYEFLMSYYFLEYKNGVLFLAAKNGYLKKIQKIKTCLKDFPKITYPPEQELIEIYRLPGAEKPAVKESVFQKMNKKVKSWLGK